MSKPKPPAKAQTSADAAPPSAALSPQQRAFARALAELLAESIVRERAARPGREQ